LLEFLCFSIFSFSGQRRDRSCFVFFSRSLFVFPGLCHVNVLLEEVLHLRGGENGCSSGSVHAPLICQAPAQVVYLKQTVSNFGWF